MARGGGEGQSHFCVRDIPGEGDGPRPRIVHYLDLRLVRAKRDTVDEQVNEAASVPVCGARATHADCEAALAGPHVNEARMGLLVEASIVGEGVAAVPEGRNRLLQSRVALVHAAGDGEGFVACDVLGLGAILKEFCRRGDEVVHRCRIDGRCGGDGREDGEHESSHGSRLRIKGCRLMKYPSTKLRAGPSTLARAGPSTGSARAGLGGLLSQGRASCGRHGTRSSAGLLWQEGGSGSRVPLTMPRHPSPHHHYTPPRPVHHPRQSAPIPPRRDPPRASHAATSPRSPSSATTP